jgi:glucose/arabinose dehydrogenase
MDNTRIGRQPRFEQRFAIAALLLTTACGLGGCGGDDDGSEPTAGSSGGAGLGVSGQGGTGGAGPVGGTGGAGGTGAGGAGSGGAGTVADGGTDASTTDAGGDAGTGGAGATVCRAPEPAPSAGNACPSSDPVPLRAELVRSGLSVPVFVTHAPGDATRLFVVERGGRIVILDPASGDEIADFLVLDDPPLWAGSGASAENGLLGMAFHPDYPEDPRFFVNYTAMAPQRMTRVSVFEVSADDPNAADASSEQVLLDFGQPQGNHNGGMLAFGHDGCLYVGTGDGGGANDSWPGIPEGNGQNLATVLGKLLRLDVDDPNTGAPGNLQGAGVPHIWDYGLRNPWRFSFDRQSGDLYIGDVGQGAREEVNVEPRGTGHKNYGWKIAEGSICRPGGPASCNMNGLEPPVDEYPHGSGDDCVVGGYVYRGSTIPSLQGWYVYGDNGPGRRMRAFVWDGQDRCGDRTIVFGTGSRSGDNLAVNADITSFGEDAAGELYVTTTSAVYRIVAQ